MGGICLEFKPFLGSTTARTALVGIFPMDLKSKNQKKTVLMELRYGKPQGRCSLICSGPGKI